MCVRWGSTFSDSFPIANGVRQGGVLSPILFTLYMDDLLMDLKSQGVGCFWDSFFAGALCYADDLVLLAPSPSALRIMICCCEDFVASRGLRLMPPRLSLYASPTLLPLVVTPASCSVVNYYPLSTQLPILVIYSTLT